MNATLRLAFASALLTLMATVPLSAQWPFLPPTDDSTRHEHEKDPLHLSE